MDRYSFDVELFHLLLQAGLSRRTPVLFQQRCRARPPRREPNGPDGSRRSPGGRSARPSPPAASPPPFGRFGRPHWAHPTPWSPPHDPSVSPPPAPGPAVAAGTHPVPQLVEVVPLRLPETADADGVHARRSAVGLDLHPRLMNKALIDLKRLHLRLRSNHQLLPSRGDLRSIWPARPLRSSPITEPSPLLRAGPPLCLASVLCPLRFRPLGVLPLATRTGKPRRYRPVVGIEATGSPVPCQRPRRAHATYTPDATRAARSPPPGSGLAPRAGLCPGDTHNLRFRRHRSTFRCVRSGSSMFVFSSHT